MKSFIYVLYLLLFVFTINGATNNLQYDKSKFEGYPQRYYEINDVRFYVFYDQFNFSYWSLTPSPPVSKKDSDEVYQYLLRCSEELEKKDKEMGLK